MKRTGTDPRLDEDVILQMLDAPLSVDSIDVIQAGTARALLDMYDRGMTRQEFCENASACLALYAQCAKLWLLKNIETAHGQQPLTEASFREAHDGIIAIMKLQVGGVIDAVKRLQQCPTSEDPVH